MRTLTVMGALSRTADPAHFVLTLPDGRSETLDVAAVKSARKIAGAVGQSLVELELDAKRVPEKISENLKPGRGTFAYFDHHTGFKDVTGDAPPPTIIETIGSGGEPLHGHAPFAAAMPRQADPATRAVLEYWANAFSRIRTYYNANNWTGDQHHIMKVQLDPQ